MSQFEEKEMKYEDSQNSIESEDKDRALSDWVPLKDTQSPEDENFDSQRSGEVRISTGQPHTMKDGDSSDEDIFSRDMDTFIIHTSASESPARCISSLKRSTNDNSASSLEKRMKILKEDRTSSAEKSSISTAPSRSSSKIIPSGSYHCTIMLSLAPPVTDGLACEGVVNESVHFQTNQSNFFSDALQYFSRLISSYHPTNVTTSEENSVEDEVSKVFPRFSTRRSDVANLPCTSTFKVPHPQCQPVLEKDAIQPGGSDVEAKLRLSVDTRTDYENAGDIPVYAKWGDDFFYAGKVTGLKMPIDKYKIVFYDGKLSDVRYNDIIFDEFLTSGTKVSFDVKDTREFVQGYEVYAIVPPNGYKLKDEKGLFYNTTRERVSCHKNNANHMIPLTSDPLEKPRSPMAIISEENILEGKRTPKFKRLRDSWISPITK